MRVRACMCACMRMCVRTYMCTHVYVCEELSLYSFNFSKNNVNFLEKS